MSLLDQLKSKESEEGMEEVQSEEAQEEETEESSVEDKLRRKRNRELFPDEVKDGQWEEYKEAIESLKEFAKVRKFNYLDSIVGVNNQYKKRVFVRYNKKKRAYNSVEQKFYTAKEKFENTLKEARKEFQEVIEKIASDSNYEGKVPSVERSAFIRHSGSFRRWMKELG